MVGLQAISALEPVPCESLQLSCRAEVIATSFINTCRALHHASVHMDLGLDSQQHRVVHDVEAGQEV